MRPALFCSLGLLLTACASDPSALHARNTAARGAQGTALTDHHWLLRQATGANGQALPDLIDPSGKRPPLQLDFHDGRVGSRNTCNGIGGDYHLEHGRIVVGPMMQTMMACPEALLMARERTIRAVLHANPEFMLDGAANAPRLTLRGAGDTLVFEGELTAQARYGSQGVTVFLEVAPDAVACVGAPGAQCLRIREVHYDDQGLRQGAPSPWTTLTQPIEGYTHRAGTRDVLRVTRYDVPHPAPGAPPQAYVLDTVIETDLAPNDGAG